MQRLGATDDEVQLRSLLGVVRGRRRPARGRGGESSTEIDRVDKSGATFGGTAFRDIGRAEAGACAWRRCGRAAPLPQVRRARCESSQFPGIPRTGLEPWTLFGDSTALTAHAQLAQPDAELGYGRELYCHLSRARAASPGSRQPTPGLSRCAGMVLFALGEWGLLRQAAPVDDAVAAAGARRPFRLQPDDPDDGLGADRPPRRGGGAGADRRAPGRVRRQPRRRTC